MRCRDCAEGRRFTADSFYCVQYGIIIREKSKCTRKGARMKEKEEAPDAGTSEAETEGRSHHAETL